MSQNKMSRRRFLLIAGAGGAGACAVTCGAATYLGAFDRLLGISKTPLLEKHWTYAEDALVIALADVDDLRNPGDAVRLEDDALPERVLVVHGLDGEFYAFKNECTHAKRRIDPDGGQLKCTSVSGSTFDYEGHVVDGAAEDDLTTYPVEVQGEQLIIRLA